MKNTRIVALAMVILLAVSFAGVSRAEQAGLPTPEITAAPVEIVVDVTPEASLAPEAGVLPEEPAYSPDPEAAQTPADTMTESTPEPELTAEPDTTAEPIAPETEAPAETAAPVVSRSVSIQMIVPDNLQLGDTVTLVATLTGYEGLNVSLQWQYTFDGEHWFDASGANGMRYSFAVSEDMAGTGWRLAVTIL